MYMYPSDQYYHPWLPMNPKYMVKRARRKGNRRIIRRSKVKRAPRDALAPTHRLPGPSDPTAALLYRAPVFAMGSKRIKLPYYEQGLNITGTAGALAKYQFSANGCYDPNITGAGHQPLGFDTMMTFYEQGVCLASKITVTFMNNGANACRVGVVLTPDTTTPVTGDVVENGLLRMVPLDAPAYATGAGNGQRIKGVSLSCDCASYFGRKSFRELLDDPNLQFTAAANPPEQVYYQLITWGAWTGDNTNVYADVVLEYDCIFWEPRKVAGQ